MTHKSNNKALRFLLCTNGIILLAGAMLAPIYAIFVEEVGGDVLDAGIAGGAFALAAGVTVLISGRLSDKLSRHREVVACGYAIMAVSFFLMLFVHAVWSLILVQIVMGLGEAIYLPAFDALYSQPLDDHKEGSEWGMWEALNYFTTAVGAIAGGIIVQYFGFDPLFVLMGLLCLGSAVFVIRIPRKAL
jgi:MFS family permease